MTETYRQLPLQNMGGERASFSALNAPTELPTPAPTTEQIATHRLKEIGVIVPDHLRMEPRVPYELLGVTGLEGKIFEADLENPAMGHEGRGNGIDYEKII